MGFEPAARHRSEQYFTVSQSRAHLRRQVNGRPQAAQILLGKSAFFRILAIPTFQIALG